MNGSVARIGVLSLSLAVVVGCADHHHDDDMATTMPTIAAPVPPQGNQAMPRLKKIAVAKIMPSQAATTQPTNNNVTGTVTFTQLNDKMVIVADISGLAPNSTHGFHIHEKGDLSAPNLMSTGNHYDPEMTKFHGDPHDMHHAMHAGDMGNLKADATGHAHLELTVKGLTIDGPTDAILGHAVIIHGKADDLKTQPAGNAGPRIAGGVIEAVN